MKRKYYVVEIENNKIGFFATLQWCLTILDYCKENSLIPYFILKNELYVDKRKEENWFNYFFRIRNLKEKDKKNIKKVKIIRINHIDNLNYINSYNKNMNFEKANHLIRDYISINRGIIKEVNRFCRENFQGRKTLGIHYRGTDKMNSEAPQISYEETLKIIEEYLKIDKSIDCIFVTSDENDFINYVKIKLPKFKVISYESKITSKDKIPPHKKILSNNYLKGKEALTISIILSKCNYLIKTASIMSGWSKVFNPQLPVKLINPPFEKFLWFPDREIEK